MTMQRNRRVSGEIIFDSNDVVVLTAEEFFAWNPNPEDVGIQFISYDGEYPSYCYGKLTVKIGEEFVVFPVGSLRSGGMHLFDDEYMEHVEEGPWRLCYAGIPENLRTAIESVVNEKLPWGCCGGCV